MQDSLSRTFAALADPTRRAILAQIGGGSLTVNDIVAANSLSQPAISKHLKVLEDAQLVRRERISTTRPCTLDPVGLRAAAQWVETYRQYWDAAFAHMDDLLKDLVEKEKRDAD
jgi:DNA-binding transcriptional ArsR family regulator